MTRFGAAMRRIDERRPGINLPLLSVSQTKGILRQSELSDRPPRADSLDAYKICRQGDIVFNKMSIRSGAMGVAPEDGLVTYHYEVMRPIGDTDPRYIVYLMKSPKFTSELVRRERGIGAGGSAGVRTTEVPFSVLRTIDTFIPSAQSQSAIADYLDMQTAKIDALISKQEQLIETLAERRQTVISHGVTKGLDPNVPMKDSGVDWMGQIPASWPVVKVGHAYSVTVGKMLNASKATENGEQAPYLRAANIQPDGIDVQEVKYMHVTAMDRRSLDLRANDVVVVEGGGGYGRSDVLRQDMNGWVFQNHVLRVRPRAGNTSDFLNYLMKTINANGHVASLSNHATIPSISSEKLASVRFGLPERSVQRQIVGHLNHETSKIDALSAKAREMIDILKERRRALISAAVTGKIDVRGLT